MASSPNTMAQKILQAQEAPSDHGDCACPFLFLKIPFEPLRMPVMMT